MVAALLTLIMVLTVREVGSKCSVVAALRLIYASYRLQFTNDRHAIL